MLPFNISYQKLSNFQSREIIHLILHHPLPTGVQYHHGKSNEGLLKLLPNTTSATALPSSRSLNGQYANQQTHNHQSQLQSHQNVLNADDLGMLMLLVHECRIMLWQDRCHFSRQEKRNVLEDLAELAGERGAVSVQQQLQIIVRMCRTYSFLKVISSGLPFSFDNTFV